MEGPDVDGCKAKRMGPLSTTSNIPVSNTRDALRDVEGSGAKRTRGSSTTSNMPVSNTRDALVDVCEVDAEGKTGDELWQMWKTTHHVLGTSARDVESLGVIWNERCTGKPVHAGREWEFKKKKKLTHRSFYRRRVTSSHVTDAVTLCKQTRATRGGVLNICE